MHMPQHLPAEVRSCVHHGVLGQIIKNEQHSRVLVVSYGNKGSVTLCPAGTTAAWGTLLSLGGV